MASKTGCFACSAAARLSTAVTVTILSRYHPSPMHHSTSILYLPTVQCVVRRYHMQHFKICTYYSKLVPAHCRRTATAPHACLARYLPDYDNNLATWVLPTAGQKRRDTQSIRRQDPVGLDAAWSRTSSMNKPGVLFRSLVCLQDPQSSPYSNIYSAVVNCCLRPRLFPRLLLCTK